MPGVFSDTALWQLCPCKVSAGRRPVDLVEDWIQGIEMV